MINRRLHHKSLELFGELLCLCFFALNIINYFVCISFLILQKFQIVSQSCKEIVEQYVKICYCLRKILKHMDSLLVSRTKGRSFTWKVFWGNYTQFFYVSFVYLFVYVYNFFIFFKSKSERET